MTEIRMPQLADGLKEATIIRWLQHDGAFVAEGADLLEIETDKVTMIQQSEASGLLRIVARDGATVPVGEMIAQIVDAADLELSEAAAENTGEDEAELALLLPAAASDVRLEASDTGQAPDPKLAEWPSDSPVETPVEHLRATPLARLVARRNAVDLSSVTGTGPRALITRSDVLRVSAGDDVRAPSGSALPKTDGSRVETPSRVQEIVAERMTTAKATVPEFQIETEATMDGVLAMRSEIKRLGDADVPTINDFILMAVAIALKAHPRVNGSYEDGRFRLYDEINVGFAVADDDALYVPVVRNADQRTLLDIAAETRELVDRVRSGTATAESLSGGTFTVSNLGMFGMTAITPIINPPQAAILGVGAIRSVLVPAPAEGFAAEQHMTLSLTCDHRILSGADAARFLALIRALLEQPLRLVHRV